MSQPRIAVVDYGVGNINSIMRALERCDCAPFLTEDPEAIRSANGIVLPGVGAFASGMEGLERRGLISCVREAASANTPMLGICLGAQLLLTEGHEFGRFPGLNVIPGIVERMALTEPSVKIPQIGWNTIQPPKAEDWHGTILEGCGPGDFVYFVHSYVMRPHDPKHILAETTYGGVTFCSAIRSGNVVGCQFHPEKSGEVGARMLRRFVGLAANASL